MHANPASAGASYDDVAAVGGQAAAGHAHARCGGCCCGGAVQQDVAADGIDRAACNIEPEVCAPANQVDCAAGGANQAAVQECDAGAAGCGAPHRDVPCTRAHLRGGECNRDGPRAASRASDRDGADTAGDTAALQLYARLRAVTRNGDGTATAVDLIALHPHARGHAAAGDADRTTSTTDCERAAAAELHANPASAGASYDDVAAVGGQAAAGHAHARCGGCCCGGAVQQDVAADGIDRAACNIEPEVCAPANQVDCAAGGANQAAVQECDAGAAGCGAPHRDVPCTCAHLCGV